MPLKDQVANLELSQQLKDLGYPQESLFYWHYSYNPTAKKVNEPYVLFNPYEKGDEINISAPTVAELDEELSKYGEYIVEEFCGEITVEIAGKQPIYEKSKNGRADVRAKLLIHLLQNKLIEL